MCQFSVTLNLRSTRDRPSRPAALSVQTVRAVCAAWWADDQAVARDSYVSSQLPGYSLSSLTPWFHEFPDTRRRYAVERFIWGLDWSAAALRL